MMAFMEDMIEHYRGNNQEIDCFLLGKYDWKVFEHEVHQSLGSAFSKEQVESNCCFMGIPVRESTQDEFGFAVRLVKSCPCCKRNY